MPTPPHGGVDLETKLRSAQPDDFEPVLKLLAAAGLPLVGVANALPHFVVAEVRGTVVAAAGLELHGADALLRSVVVAARWRGTGLGQALVRLALANAASLGVRSVYLLTTTAEQYFASLGFRALPRESAPLAISRSDEFREACPASAAFMTLRLAAA